SFTTGSQFQPSVGVAADGDFVIAWGSDNQDYPYSDGIYAQRFAADGTPQDEEFLVNSTTIGDQTVPSIGIATNGDFVITWQSRDRLSPIDIYAQRYAADGTPQGDEFEVSPLATGSQSNSAIGVAADGDFVITWQRYGPEYDDRTNIYAQRYSADGTPLDGEFQVNSSTTDIQRFSSLAMDADGDFVVAWTSFRQDGSGFGVFAQRYAADGTPQGNEFQVNSFTTGDQRLPSVGVDADGDFVIAWEGRGQDDPRDPVYIGVFAQRFAASPVANEDDAQLPSALALDAVFPNPVRDAATLRYALPTTAAVRLTVKDVLGRTVLTRTEGVQPAGQHEARLALDGLPSGVYVVRLDADGANATQRVTLIR
ncbi:MAG: T9SS type A sorting domain-containing protein, partial [Bacteroidota bacterium]